MAARTRRLTAALTALLALLVGAAAFAASSAASPYSTQATLSVSTQNPAMGATLTVSGSGYTPTEQVNLTLHSQTYNLGSATTDASGDFSTTVTLPAGVSGSHTITGTAATSGMTASVSVTIGSSAGGGGSGDLAFTGAAVLGIGGIGVALLISGGVLLLAGQRRRSVV
jgi:hypothetical protein